MNKHGFEDAGSNADLETFSNVSFGELVGEASGNSQDLESEGSEETVEVAHVDGAKAPEIIPFHIPHKKLFAKYEIRQKDGPEPLRGFTDNQNARRKRYIVAPKPNLASKETVDDFVSLFSSGTTSKLFREAKGPLKVTMTQDVIPKKVRHRPEVCDQLAIIHQLRTNPKLGFFYMIYSAHKSSEYYSPYTLKVVPYQKIDKKNFLTISKDGVTHYRCSEIIFTPLDVWEREYMQYCKLQKIKSFSNFRIWKSFFVWKKNLSWRKFVETREELKLSLFVLNPGLRNALLELREMIIKLSFLTFTDMSIQEGNELFVFVENQMTKLELAQGLLRNFRDTAKDLISTACHSTMLILGFTTDDHNFYIGSQILIGSRRTKDGKRKMTYAEQADKRRFCERLSCFIHLADLMMMVLFHDIVRNSVADFADALRTHYQYLPRQSAQEGTEVTAVLEQPRSKTDPQTPLFVTDVVIEPTLLSLDPSEAVYYNAIQQLMGLWEESVVNINILMMDPHFDPFLEPMINGKHTERAAGTGPEIDEALAMDPYIIQLKDDINDIFNQTFSAANRYIKRFTFVQQFYNSNEKVNPDKIRNGHEIELFRRYLTNYHKQIEDINEIVLTQALGVLNLQFENFKETVLPSSTGLLEVVQETLPRIGRTKTEALTTETNDSMQFLDKDPVTTLEYVDYLQFLENSQVRVDAMESELDYCKDLFDLIDEFQVEIHPDDLANYLNLSVILSSLRAQVDRKVGERMKIIDKFNDQISRDISALIGTVGSIKDEAMEPWLIDIESNPEDAAAALADLHEQLSECQKKAAEFRGYQRSFKVTYRSHYIKSMQEWELEIEKEAWTV